MEEYNIIFATDQNYIQPLSVALLSLLQNNSSLNFKIYIINSGIEKKKWQKLESIIQGYKVELIDIFIDDFIFEKLITNHHFTKANYYRLLIPDFIKSNKVLYLDVDIVVNGSIKELYNIDLEDFFLGAVENPGFDRYNELKMDKDAKYFNSGVMLINVKKWRDSNLRARVIKFIYENKKAIKLVDQDGLNAIINGEWKNFPLKYNQQAVIFEKEFVHRYHCFSKKELEEARVNPIIIHYSGSSKPWQFMNNHPYKKLYWKYLRQTPFYPYIPADFTFLNIIKKIIPSTLKIKIKKILKRGVFE